MPGRYVVADASFLVGGVVNGLQNSVTVQHPFFSFRCVTPFVEVEFNIDISTGSSTIHVNGAQNWSSECFLIGKIKVNLPKDEGRRTKDPI